jgi:adenine phosphoribosyltransferase
MTQTMTKQKTLQKNELQKQVLAAVRDIPDYPKPGILFKDITTVLRQPCLLHAIVDYFYELLKDQNIQYVAGIESRGFIFGAPLAYRLGAGFIPIRKKGKLPGPVERLEYSLEYGTDCVEIHLDAIEPGGRTVLIDDLLATGGTAAASAKLLQTIQADLVSILFLIELDFLNGRAALPNVPIYDSLIHYS